MSTVDGLRYMLLLHAIGKTNTSGHSQLHLPLEVMKYIDRNTIIYFFYIDEQGFFLFKIN